MSEPPVLGTVNGYIRSDCWMPGRLTFDGTTLGLVRLAARVGRKPGDVIVANLGGRGRRGAMKYVVTSTGGGDRTPGGMWVERVRP